MMNLLPCNSGHVRLIPYARVNSLKLLLPEEILDLIGLTIRSLKMLRTVLKSGGFHISLNPGRVGGAGIETDVHLHIVPRRNGDTDFMPLLSKTHVIPEHSQTADRKFSAWSGGNHRTDADHSSANADINTAHRTSKSARSSRKKTDVHTHLTNKL